MPADKCSVLLLPCGAIDHHFTAERPWTVWRAGEPPSLDIWHVGPPPIDAIAFWPGAADPIDGWRFVTPDNALFETALRNVLRLPVAESQQHAGWWMMPAWVYGLVEHVRNGRRSNVKWLRVNWRSPASSYARPNLLVHHEPEQLYEFWMRISVVKALAS